MYIYIYIYIYIYVYIYIYIYVYICIYVYKDGLGLTQGGYNKNESRWVNPRPAHTIYTYINLRFSMYNIYLLFAKKKAFIEGCEDELARAKNRRVGA